MDFPGEGLISRIINSNFGSNLFPLTSNVSGTPATIGGPPALRVPGPADDLRAEPHTAREEAPAEDLANDRLNRVFGYRLGRAIPIRTAVDDATTDTATLQPVRRVHLYGHDRPKVDGSTPTGVAGATGLLLGGKGNGQPGSDFVPTSGQEIPAGGNPPDPTAGHPALHQSRPKTRHAVPRVPITSTASSTTHALSARALDAVLGTVVVREKNKK